MKALELFRLRELFWRIDKQSQGVFQRLIETEQVPKAAPELLTNVVEFLRKVKESTSDSELKKDCERLQEMIGTKIASPFGHM